MFETSTKLASWDELIETDEGIATIVVSFSGGLQWPRVTGFGEKRSLVVCHYERFGNKVLVVTRDFRSGQWFGNVLAKANSIAPSPFPSNAESHIRLFQDETIDSRGVLIDSEGGVRILGFRGGRSQDEALDGCRWLAGALASG